MFGFGGMRRLILLLALFALLVATAPAAHAAWQAPNARQAVDTDGDGTPDDADADDDNDGLADADEHFTSIKDPDTDDDAVGDAADNCARESNPDQADGDNDGVGNLCDRPALTKFKVKAVKRGLKVSFRLSEESTVAFTVYRKRSRRFAYYFDVPDKKRKAGAHSFTIKYPKFKGKPLAPGAYALGASATDAGFDSSGSQDPRPFTIKAPRR
jgi:hypothetical protein